MQGWKLLLHHTESCIKSHIWKQHIHFNATNIYILHILLALHISASENLFNSAIFQMKREELGIVLFAYTMIVHPPKHKCWWEIAEHIHLITV